MENTKTNQNEQAESEAAVREAGNREGGGKSLNTPLEDGQQRGVDADGEVAQGTHGGPKEPGKVPQPGREQGK